jgi:hypothetical protein
MVIAFADHCTVDSPSMSDCNFVVVDEGYIRGVVAFRHSTFRKCEFDSVTFVMQKDFAKLVRDQISAAGGKPEFLGAPLD